jgi:mRNA interferase RelE/StbE
MTKHYTITLSKTAQKQLDRLSDNIAKPILNAIALLSDNPRPPGYKKLKGRNGYRIRQGNYRIIYDVFDNILTVDVITIAHRKDVYDL